MLIPAPPWSGAIQLSEALACVPEPHKPANPCLSGSRTQAKASLSWIAPDHGGAEISNYKIYRSTSPTGALTFIADAGPKTSYVDYSVDPNVPKYYYTVTALNSQGESIDSNKIELSVVVELIENQCIIPGLSLLTDASGDYEGLSPETGLPAYDVLLV